MSLGARRQSCPLPQLMGRGVGAAPLHQHLGDGLGSVSPHPSILHRHPARSDRFFGSHLRRPRGLASLRTGQKGFLRGRRGTGQRALILQDTLIHVASYLVTIIIIIVVVVTAYILSSIPCFLLLLLLLFSLLPYLLVPLGRDVIRGRHDMVLQQWDRAVIED